MVLTKGTKIVQFWILRNPHEPVQDTNLGHRPTIGDTFLTCHGIGGHGGPSRDPDMIPLAIETLVSSRQKSGSDRRFGEASICSTLIFQRRKSVPVGFGGGLVEYGLFPAIRRNFHEKPGGQVTLVSSK